jgi:hypothetical protein
LNHGLPATEKQPPHCVDRSNKSAPIQKLIDQLLALADEWLKLAAVVEKKWLP